MSQAELFLMYYLKFKNGSSMRATGCRQRLESEILSKLDPHSSETLRNVVLCGF